MKLLTTTLVTSVCLTAAWGFASLALLAASLLVTGGVLTATCYLCGTFDADEEE